MALDGAFLHMIKTDLEREVLGSRIDKISQPSREEIIITLRFKGGSKKLLVSAGANSPRIHFTQIPLENPKTPPMFCMLLRKYLGAGKLIFIKQIGLDRILHLGFETVNELGDTTVVTMAVEIMGRHSNIILVNEQGKVIDSIKRIDEEMSSVRMVLPGLPYTLPPMQDKVNLLEEGSEGVLKALEKADNGELSKALLSVMQGMSPVVCREIAAYVTREQTVYKDDLTPDQWVRLKFYLDNLRDRMNGEHPAFTMLMEKNGKPKEFSFFPILQYGTALIQKPYETASGLLDNFYSERDRIERMKQRSHGLLKLLVSATERITRKLASQEEELKECGERERLKTYGDLLNANLYQMQKGMDSVTLENFYDEMKPVNIPLDPALTPVKNAQKYYTEYRKAATAEKMLTSLIAQGEQELVYLDSVFDAVSRTTGESELLEIREELAEQGYLKNYKNRNKQLKPQPPIQYRSSDGFTILCGRNNKQNDKLTLKTARGEDLWCHTHNIPGSHVIIVAEGREIPDRTIEEACMIAAYNSKARGSSQVPVDYTKARYVKKPNGAKPGMVIFTDNRTAYLTPDEERVKALEC